MAGHRPGGRGRTGGRPRFASPPGQPRLALRRQSTEGKDEDHARPSTSATNPFRAATESPPARRCRRGACLGTPARPGRPRSPTPPSPGTTATAGPRPSCGRCVRSFTVPAVRAVAGVDDASAPSRSATCCPRAASRPGRNSRRARRLARRGPAHQPAPSGTGVGPRPRHRPVRSRHASADEAVRDHLDRPDPPALAAFYQRATGLERIRGATPTLPAQRRDGLLPGFQRVDDYRVPTGGRIVLASSTSTSTSTSTYLDEAETRLPEPVRAGRSTSPRPNRWRVLLAPPGTPCVRRPGADRARTRVEARGEGMQWTRTLPFVAGRASRARASCPLCAPGRGIGCRRTAVRFVPHHAGRAPVPRPIASSSRSPSQPRSPQPAAPQPRSPWSRGPGDRRRFPPHTGMVMGVR
ncbi:hypothetical protein EDD94_7798 [Streptomyces sp. PanSC9]|nr:hypothetical protein EDD94_7798 [Streptomyces sp. PanSC9]